MLFKELWVHVFSYLGVSDLGRIASVSKEWNELSASDTLWSQFFLPLFFCGDSRLPGLSLYFPVISMNCSPRGAGRRGGGLPSNSWGRREPMFGPLILHFEGTSEDTDKLQLPWKELFRRFTRHGSFTRSFQITEGTGRVKIIGDSYGQELVVVSPSPLPRPAFTSTRIMSLGHSWEVLPILLNFYTIMWERHQKSAWSRWMMTRCNNALPSVSWTKLSSIEWALSSPMVHASSE